MSPRPRSDPQRRIRELLAFLYGPRAGRRTWEALAPRLEAFRRRLRPVAEPLPLSEKDAFLIAYGDQLRAPDEPPLQTLQRFLERWADDALPGLHLLPFFPYSSDDGFAVVNYKSVRPELGSWRDVEALARRYKLMVDVVLNHVSSRHPWVEGFRRGEAPYRDFFLVVEPDAEAVNADWSRVVRPRTTPLFTPIKTVDGERRVWTTFGPDQIDLNYRNPQVLLEMLDVMLFYVEKGARVLRLDAVAYLWKEPGTPCVHLPQTHALVKLFRAVLDEVAPGVLLITETNVPHRENVSYFGEGDEAHLVYNFALPPLVLHRFHTGSARRLTQWAEALLEDVPEGCAFFNFLASHDGIGLLPARGLLSEGEVEALVRRTQEHGGLVSYRSAPRGEEPYELNIALYDALNDPYDSDSDDERDVRRFLAAHAIMLSLAGVPALYFHSLVGSRNCHECVQRTGHPRAIHRERLSINNLEAELSDEASRRGRVLRGLLRLLRARRRHPAFHPLGKQRVLSVEEGAFALLREAPDGCDPEPLLVLVDVSGRSRTLSVERTQLPTSVERWRDALDSDGTFSVQNGGLVVPLGGYQVRWLVPCGGLNQSIRMGMQTYKKP